ncbi:tetraspanin-1-like [Drosophila novamexicana]|uniref:tetraspanin-1-like n=1 Tax=Drosophila novamexicana TaxID=47314 RepID=UPI0011E5DD9A|nr:tetraspanin-1-like [Drosophila novamexicana]
MGCGAGLVKFLLILFNVLCLICGATLAILGALMVLDIKDVSYTKELLTVNSVSIVTLVLGTLVFIISLLGCCGALCGQPCQLRAYSLVMLILFVCQITFVIYVWTEFYAIRTHVVSFVKIVWKQRETDGILLHRLERQLKCCGMNGFMDYIKNGEHLPASCCGLPNSQTCPEAIFRGGCLDAFAHLWDSSAKVVKIGVLIVSGVIFTASMFASYLAHKIRRGNEFEYY